MSKKHFEALATKFNEKMTVLKTTEYLNGDERAAALNATTSAAQLVADVCADANPRFDTRRFLAACGIN